MSVVTFLFGAPEQDGIGDTVKTTFFAFDWSRQYRTAWHRAGSMAVAPE
jgi:hypothetical protein